MAVRALLSIMLSLVAAANAFDCLQPATAQQAMDCCHSMACSKHDQQHGMDCCREMASPELAFVVPAAFLHQVSIGNTPGPMAFAAMPSIAVRLEEPLLAAPSGTGSPPGASNCVPLRI
jgi:hypothetical protein